MPALKKMEASRLHLVQLVKKQAEKLHVSDRGVDPARLLLAICARESDFGRQCGLRTEKAYSPRGKYFKESISLQRAFVKYGAAACGSWGAWQLLYVTASELGFKGNPWDFFMDPGTCLAYAIRYLNVRIVPELPDDVHAVKAIAALADGYNSGNPKDNIKPADYIEAVVKNYALPDLEKRFDSTRPEVL